MTEELRICPSCGDGNPERAKFCQSCGSRLDAQPSVEHGERRVTTIVFADLSGFTSYSEGVDIEEVRKLAEECATALGDIVVRYGGTVDKIIGDCVMAVFGAPTAHEDDPERAVRAALDMQTYVAENAQRFAELPLSIGINTGETIWAPVGPGGRHTVLGDAVNTAARIQGAADRGTALVGASTYQATRDAIAYDELEPILAKNKQERVPVWLATGVQKQTEARATQAPLVGRDEEMDDLAKRWEAVRAAREPQLVWLIGAPGIGKTRLIGALTERVAGDARVFSGRCLAYGEGITYWPVIGMVRAAAGILFDDTDDIVSTKLGALLEEVGIDDLDELRTIAVAVANLVAAPTTPRGTYTAEEISQGELHWGIRRLFELLAAKRPVVLVFEDLHWAEPTLFDLIGSFLVEDGAPILLLGAARPEIKDADIELLSPADRRHVMDLEALPADASETLLAELFGTEEHSEGFAKLVEASDGNPLYLEEIARLLRDRGGAVGEGERVETLIASGLQGLIGSRIDRLPTDHKRVAGHASVVGDVFWTGAVSYLAEANVRMERSDSVSEGVDQTLDSLEQRDVVRGRTTSSIAGEREYAFAHGLVREVAYSRLPKSQRSVLHERCGEWIARLPGGREEFAEIVAHHLEQACRLAGSVSLSAKPPPVLGAVQVLRIAARKAEKREGLREAERFYSRAIELAGDRYPEAAAELRLYRAEIYEIFGRTDDAVEQWTGVVEEATRLGRTDLHGRALLKLADLDVRKGDAASARERLTTARELAAQLGDRDLEVRAAVSLADFRALFEGQTASAIEELDGAVAMAEEVGQPALEVEAQMHLGNQLYNVGELAKAGDALDRALELASAQGSFRDEARVSHILGLVRLHRGDLEEAERLASRVLAWLDRSQDRFLRLQILELLGKIALAKQDFAAAIEHLRAALEIANAFGSWLVVDVSRYLSEAEARAGNVEAVTKVAADARAQLTFEDPYMQSAVLMAEGMSAFAKQDLDGLRERFSEALPLLEAQELNLDLCESRLVYGRALRQLGDADGAREELRRLRELAFRLGATGLVAGAERELALADAT